MNEHKFLKPKKKKSFGKKLCILLMVLFTLVMAADLANLFLTPARDQMRFGPGTGDFQMPEGGGFTMPEGMEMPEGEDFQMPGGDFQIPESENFQGPSGFPSGEAGGQPSFDAEAPSFGGQSGSSRGGFLQMARNAWLPILIVCALGDLICLMVLIRIRRKEKALALAFDNGTGMPPLMYKEEEDEEEPPRRKGGSWIIIVCLAVVFAMILSMFPTGEDTASTATVHQEVISGTAAAAQVNTVLSGAGTLEADTLTPVTVPQQVTVLKYHVRNGETVTAGDPLVSVDKTSAASAVMELSGLLEDLDSDLSSEKTKSQSARIASTTSGRVKKIYGWEGDKVTDVLYEHGALMLLSLDGYMKVVFESEEDLSVGDTVEVLYAGGTEEGRIATVRLGKVTVTLSDKKAPYGAEATIVDKNGNAIGQGKLEINSEMKIIGYYGTIEQVRVDVGDKVTADNTLFSLKNVGETTNYQLLLSRRKELEDQLQKLSQLSRTGMIYAENDGIVSGVPEDAKIELLSSSGGAAISDLSTASGGWKIVLLSNTTEEFTPTANVYYAAKVVSADTTAVNVLCVETGQTNASFDPAAYDSQMLQSYTLAPSLFQSLPQAGTYLVFQATESGITVTVPDSGDGSVPETKLNGTYAAKLVSNTGGKLYIWLNPTAGDYTAVDLSTLEAQMTQFGGYAYAPAISSNDITLGSSIVKLADLKADDLLLLNFTDDMVTQIIKAQRTVSQQPMNPSEGQSPDGTGGMPSGGMTAGGSGAMPSGGSGFAGGMPSGTGGSMAQTYDNYIVEETELLYISDQKEVSLVISVDELDILSIQTGLDAQVTLDAMKGQSFPGTIRRIGHEGTNEGGNTKFTVTIVLPRQAAMLDGMNASVKIVTATSNADVTIPAAALVEEDGNTYVYTAYDAETDTLGGLTAVETGVSDGELVEILSGLKSGDPYYYRYADTVTYNFLSSL